jgi:hypothetical protein
VVPVSGDRPTQQKPTSSLPIIAAGGLSGRDHEDVARVEYRVPRAAGSCLNKGRTSLIMAVFRSNGGVDSSWM